MNIGSFNISLNTGPTNEDPGELAKRPKKEEKISPEPPKKDVVRKKQETPTISLRSGTYRRH